MPSVIYYVYATLWSAVRSVVGNFVKMICRLGLVVVARLDATCRVADAEYRQSADVLNPRAPTRATRLVALPYLNDANDKATGSNHQRQPAGRLAEHRW